MAVKGNSFKYTTASDVISGSTNSGFFAGKIVLIGASAIGTFDQKATPLSGNMPGVEKNANVIRNILMGNFLHGNREQRKDFACEVFCFTIPYQQRRKRKE